MTDENNDAKPRRFHYAYVFEGLLALVTLGMCALIAFLASPVRMFCAWYGMLILGGVVIFFLKRGMEKDLRKHFGDEKARLIYTVGVYWIEGGLFLAVVAGMLFFIVLRATGKM